MRDLRRCPECGAELFYFCGRKEHSRAVAVEVAGVYDGALFYMCPDRRPALLAQMGRIGCRLAEVARPSRRGDDPMARTSSTERARVITNSKPKPKPKMLTLPAWQCLGLEEAAEHNQIAQVEIVRRALEAYFPVLGLDKEDLLARSNGRAMHANH